MTEIKILVKPCPFCGQLFFFERIATEDTPAGYTVSKLSTLPAGDFKITEYQWGKVILWFVDADNFSADEREEAYRGWKALREFEGDESDY